jgi:hypothetical protein
MILWGVGLWVGFNALVFSCRLYRTRRVDLDGDRADGRPSPGAEIVRLIPRRNTRGARGSAVRAQNSVCYASSEAYGLPLTRPVKLADLDLTA